MGLDLSLLLIKEGSEYWATDCVMMDRDSDLFDEILARDPQPLPDPIKFYPPYQSCASSEGWVSEDEYGDKLTFLKRYDLAQVRMEKFFKSSGKNRAILEMLYLLPEKQKICLFWH
jgi:hypothetical protein